MPRTSLAALLLLAAACHPARVAAPSPANQGGDPAAPAVAGAGCGMSRAADLFGASLRGQSGTCRRDADALLDDRGVVARIAACGITVFARGLPDEVGAQVGDDLRAVVARYPAGSHLGCRPRDGGTECGLLFPGDDGDPIVQYHLAATIAAPLSSPAALDALGDAPVVSYFESDGCD